jgi:hypothetical protein
MGNDKFLFNANGKAACLTGSFFCFVVSNVNLFPFRNQIIDTVFPQPDTTKLPSIIARSFSVHVSYDYLFSKISYGTRP